MRGRARLGLRLSSLLLLSAVFMHQSAFAEPYLAVQKGLKCGMCHASPSGGGKRTVFGNVYAQTELSGRTLDLGELWTGELGQYFAVGGDIRGGWNRLDVPSQAKSYDTDLEEFLGYAELKLVPNRLMAYVDAKIRPGDPVVREAYLRISSADGRWWLRGGDFFLPFGLRIQDDDAFIRQVPGINYNTPDTGLELGLEQGRWTAQLAITRGTAGGPEVDSGKQYSLRVSHVTPKWRVGGSLNFNDSEFGDRKMQNVFAGLRTGRIAWLAEFDYIIDEGSPTGRRRLWASLVEANYALKRGHNLKITAEYLDPDSDVSNNEQNRLSLVWEYFPIQFLQIRLGYTIHGGIPQNPAQNREQLFLEIHLPF